MSVEVSINLNCLWWWSFLSLTVWCWYVISNVCEFVLYIQTFCMAFVDICLPWRKLKRTMPHIMEYISNLMCILYSGRLDRDSIVVYRLGFKTYCYKGDKHFLSHITPCTNTCYIKLVIWITFHLDNLSFGCWMWSALAGCVLHWSSEIAVLVYVRYHPALEEWDIILH